MGSPMNQKPVPLARLSVKRFKGFVREDVRAIFTGDFLEDIEAAVAFIMERVKL